MIENTDLQKAIDALKTADFKMGEQFEVAHEIAQANETKPIFDWLHALLHRIEGDDANAHYWYRRAGVMPFEGSFEAEMDALIASASANPGVEK